MADEFSTQRAADEATAQALTADANTAISAASAGTALQQQDAAIAAQEYLREAAVADTVAMTAQDATGQCPYANSMTIPGGDPGKGFVGAQFPNNPVACPTPNCGRIGPTTNFINGQCQTAIRKGIVTI